MPSGEKSTADNTRAAVAVQMEYAAQVAGVKALAEKRKAQRKYTQEGLAAAYEAIKKYVEESYNKRQPLTVAGMQLAVGMQRDAWSRASNGDLDHLLEEYIIDNNITDEDITYDQDGLPWHYGEKGPVLLLQWSEIRKKADLMIQDQLERNCYTNKGNPAGSIFGLKAKFDWREDEGPQHLVQQLVVADLEQAKKALKMLE